MNKIYFIFFLFIAINSNAQNGLEGIIVEKYYIADANDAANDDGGSVTEGATTYRVFVDMLPGYIFQSCYALQGTHQLKIETTSTFFNNEDRGAEFPTYTKTQAANNTVMLDSWLSVGTACKDQIGVLKSEDNGMNTVINKDDILQNDDINAGIPLKEQDGMVPGSLDAPVQVGLGNQLGLFFGSSNSIPAPNSFIVEDGAWGSLAGSMGGDLDKNKVLIGQFTTDGIFTFELNVQIRRQLDLKVENYVAKNPIDQEIFEPTLTFTSETSSVKDDALAKSTLQVFPNPNIGTIYFKIPVETASSRFEIFDMAGNLVKKGKMAGTNQSIDISDLSSGLYALSVTADNKVFYSRVAKI